MPKIRLTETIRIPVDVTRFQETQPALIAKFQEYKSAGKIDSQKQTVTDLGNGLKTVVSEIVWNDADAYYENKEWVRANYNALKFEYYNKAGVPSGIMDFYSKDSVKEEIIED